MRWDDLNARARGLSTHLLGRPRLEALSRVEDLPRLAAELRFPAAGAREIEVAVRRAAAERLRVLARWCGERRPALAAVFEEEDRRSLRALLRGAVAGAPPEERLAGLVPTPDLSEGMLRELARQPAPGAVAALLSAWGNPYGPALVAEASRPQPDLFRLETALNRRFAERAVEAARRGDRELAAWVREGIDLENALAALLLAGKGNGEPATDTDPRGCFLPGGRRLRWEELAAAAAAPDRTVAARLIARAFRRTPFQEVFDRPRRGPAALESEILGLRLRCSIRAARRRPLGPAPFLSYLLRLRAEAMDLRRLIWGIALGAPPEGLAQGLVSP